MRKGILAVALAILAFPASARADEDDPSKHRLQLILRGGFVTAQTGDLSFWRGDAATGVAFDAIPALRVYTLLHLGKTSFTYDGKVTDDLAVGGELASSVDLSIESGLTITLLRRGRFTLDAFGEFEASPMRTNFNLERLAIRSEQGDFDITSYGRGHATFAYSWWRIGTGAGFHVRLGWFVPRLHIGYERVEAAIDVQLDKEGRELLRTLGHDPGKIEGSYGLGENLLTIMPGFEIRLPRRFAIDVQGIGAPIGGKLHLTVQLGLTWRP